MTRIPNVIRYIGRLGFAFLLLGGVVLAQAQPYEPVRLYDVLGDTLDTYGQFLLEPLGDQDRDGYSDFLTIIYGQSEHLRIVYGGPNLPYRELDFAYWGIDTTATRYTWTLLRQNTGQSSCADYTGDGIVDIMVDLRSTGFENACYAFLFAGGGGPEGFDTVWDWRTYGNPSSHFVSGLGDFDGNGTPDFTRSGGAWSETFLWYFNWSWPNPSTEATWAINRDGPNNNGNFQSCQGVGDVTGDGWPDFMHFVYYPDWSRHYEIWFGGPAADSIPDFEFIQDTLQYAAFAHGILGDLNGDGIADLGSYINDIIAPQTGPAIFWGGLPLNVTQPDVMLEHNSGEHINPSGAQCVGDINDDGYDDIGFRETDGRSCYLFLGGNPMDSLWSFYLPEAEFDGFRTSLVRGIGDFNGDGIDDWAISAYEDFWTTPRRGRVVVFAGDRNWGVPVTNERPAIAIDFLLGNPYPNPFNSEVIIPLTINRSAGTLDVSIYNTLGQLIYSFPNQHLSPGNTHFLRWNSTDQTGEPAASGQYFIRGKLESQIQTVTITLIK